MDSLPENERREVPWWTLAFVLPILTIAASGSRLAGVDASSLSWYLPAPVGIALVHWWGPRVLPLYALFEALLLGIWLDSSLSNVALSTVADTTMVSLSWLLSARRLRHRVRTTWALGELVRFLVLGVALPVAAAHTIFYLTWWATGTFTGDAAGAFAIVLWSSDVMVGATVGFPLLLFVTPLARRVGLSRIALETPEPPGHFELSSRALWGLFVVLFSVALGVDQGLGFERFWFFDYVVLLLVGLTLGVRAAAVAITAFCAATFGLPTVLGIPIDPFWSLTHWVIDPLTVLAVSCCVGLVVGQVRTDVGAQLRRRAIVERELRASEERFHEILGTMSEIAWAVDATDLRTIYRSPSAERVLGVEGRGLGHLPNLIDRHVHPDDRERVDDMKARALADGFAEAEYRIVRPDGEVRWLRDRARMVYGRDGEPVRYVGLASDVTAERDMEEAQRQLASRLEQSQKLESLGMLAGGLAHDFNNLLQTVLGNAELLREEVAEGRTPPDEIDERLAAVERAAGTAAQLCEELLAFAGRGRISARVLDLSSVVRDMVGLLEVTVGERVSIELRLADDAVPVNADGAKLQQVALNLVSNAADAVGDRDGRIVVTTGIRSFARDFLESTVVESSLAPGPFAFVEVRDDGTGMDGETRAHIFDPFYTTKPAGRGLGLAAVLGIVQGHGGAIHVASRPGSGTTFTVLLPVAPSWVVRPKSAGSTRNRRARGSVLFVDDEPDIRELGAQMLRRAGYTVHVADGGPAAVELVRSGTPLDLAVIDVRMPGMDGIETMQALRALRPQIPTILVSGQERADGARIAGSGAEFLSKPFRRDELLDALERALRVAAIEGGA